MSSSVEMVDGDGVRVALSAKTDSMGKVRRGAAQQLGKDRVTRAKVGKVRPRRKAIATG